MRIMSIPVPLMFVNGPPVYTRVPIDEESTSIFVKEEEALEVVDPPIEKEFIIEKKEIDPTIVAKVKKLQSPLGKRIYQGLTFVLAEEEIIGNVGKVEDNTLLIEVNGDEDQLVAIELSELQNIRWRGKSLPEN